jgi:putative ABC transport system permease protein
MARNTLSQIAAVTALNLQNIPQRLATTSVALLGIAGVVVVLIGVLSIAEGFRSVLQRSGAEDVAIVLRDGANDEMSSSISLEQTRIIEAMPEVARDAQGAIVSPELYVVADIPKRSTGTVANVPVRGVSPSAARLRQGFRIVAGRNFTPGTFEVIVGRGAASQFAGLDVGGTVKLGSTQWLVAGMFEDAGSVAQSEVWTDAKVVQDVFQRGAGYQSMRVKLNRSDAFGSFKDGLTSDDRLGQRTLTEREYFQELSKTMTALIRSVGTVIAVLMGLGAIFAALNTMYSAVSSRSREIATLRALGFGTQPVIISVLAESVVIGLLGGVLGMVIAYLAFDGIQTSTMNFDSFSQVTFAFSVTPTLLLLALAYALILGLIGGSLPCWRAARMPITSGLREL